MKNLKVLAIGSFASHGMAGLKASMSILGQRVLPVPSVILNGLTNMPDVKKQYPNFRELLSGAFRLVVHRQQKVILFIGYLGTPDQVDVILEIIESYRTSIHLILTDPVSGDKGKTYVPEDVIIRWPELVSQSAYVFPNMTELRLITGFAANHEQDSILYLDHFRKRYPHAALIVKSYLQDDTKIGVLLQQGDKQYQHNHNYWPKHYGGTGDAFVAYFTLSHFFQSLPIEEALQQAAEKIQERIRESMEKGSDELLL